MSMFSFEGYGIGFAAVAIPDMKTEIRYLSLLDMNPMMVFQSFFTFQK